MTTRVWSLPGWGDLEPGHWLTAWERLDENVVRVAPPPVAALEAWLERLDACLAPGVPCVLVGYGPGALLAVHAAARPAARAVVGALLVAPSEGARPGAGAPMPLAPLPFPSVLVHAVDDARLPVTRAEAWAQAFGSERVELPEGGCLDAAAGLGTWPAGFERLRQLRARAPFRPSPRLETDSELIAQGPLSQLRLMDEARYPWALLVPRVSAAEDARHLTANQRLQLEAETHAVSDALARAFGVDKVNVASLGNVVRQLHVHVVGRSLGDAAWPGPVWGHSPRVSASPALAAQRRGRLLEALGESGGFTAVAPAAGRAEGRRQR